MMKNAIILLLIISVIMLSGCGGSDVTQTVIQDSSKGTFKVSVNIPDPSILGKVIPLNSRYLRVIVTHTSGETVTSDFVDLSTSPQVVLNNISTGINIATLEIWDSTKTVLMAIRKYSFFMGAGQTASPPNNLMMGMGIDPNAVIIPQTVTFYLDSVSQRVYIENYDDVAHDITIQTYPPQTIHLNAVVPPVEPNTPAVFDGSSFYFNAPGTYDLYMDGSKTSSGQIVVLTHGGGGGGGGGGGTPPSTNLNGVFSIEYGFSWAVGDNGRILRTGELPLEANLLPSNTKKTNFPIRTDSEWILETSPTTQNLNGVSSYYIVDEANNRVFFKSWAVGNNGTMLYYYAPIYIESNGCKDAGIPVNRIPTPEPNSWSVVNVYTSQNLNGICFYTDCGWEQVEGWAVGNNGTILHYTEANNISSSLKKHSGGWTPVPLNLNSLNVKNNKNNFLKNSQANKDWELTPTPAPSGNVNLKSVCYVESESKGDLVEYWAVGDNGTILHYNGSEWEDKSPDDWSELDITSPPNLTDVYFTSSTCGWIVGTDTTNNKGVILCYSDGDWINGTPVDTQPPPLKGVYSTCSDVWVVGNEGTILYYQKSKNKSSVPWTPIPSVNNNNLNAVHGNCISNFAVGDANTIVEITSPTPEP